MKYGPVLVLQIPPSLKFFSLTKCDNVSTKNVEWKCIINALIKLGSA